jgi:hypothetical protein
MLSLSTPQIQKTLHCSLPKHFLVRQIIAIYLDLSTTCGQNVTSLHVIYRVNTAIYILISRWHISVALLNTTNVSLSQHNTHSSKRLHVSGIKRKPSSGLKYKIEKSRGIQCN